MAVVGGVSGSVVVAIAAAYPATEVTGFDNDDASIAVAQARAADAGVAGRARFEVAAAKQFPGSGYDLITFVDVLHDLGDPVGALVHARGALAPGGSVLLVEPRAGDR